MRRLPAVCRLMGARASTAPLAEYAGSAPETCLELLSEFHALRETRARSTERILRRRTARLAARHPCVGAVRSIGLFGAIKLVRDPATRQPLAPFNGTSEEMKRLARFFREEGLYTMVRWNYFFTNPPLTITEAELEEALEIVDRGLAIVDEAIGR